MNKPTKCTSDVYLKGIINDENTTYTFNDPAYFPLSIQGDGWELNIQMKPERKVCVIGNIPEFEEFNKHFLGFMPRPIAETLWVVAKLNEDKDSVNNFEMDKRAKELVDSKSPYEIARRLVELERNPMLLAQGRQLPFADHEGRQYTLKANYL